MKETFKRCVAPLLPCLLAAFCWLFGSCCQIPPEGFTAQPKVQRKMARLEHDLIALLPENEQNLPAAREEARWLTYTAYDQAARLARENKPVFIGWINNNLVNTKMLDRGLCWHYQHDMFRELRRRPLTYFYLGATVRDKGRGREHSCVYLNRRGKGLPGSIVLDAWASCGNLKVIYPEDRGDNWEEATYWHAILAEWFPPGHNRSRTAHIVLEEDKGKPYHKAIM